MAFLTTPVYRAETVSVAASSDQDGLGSSLGQLGGLAAMVGIDLGGRGDVQETLAVLRSREFSESFIRKHDLMPGLFARKWDESIRKWKGPEEKWPTMAEGYARFNRKVRGASQDQKTDLITVSVVWPDPDVAAKLANELTDELNREMRARAIARSNAAVEYLQRELDATAAVDTRGAINRLLENQINQRMYANVTEQYALRIVDRALPPDRKDKLRPKRLAMIIVGAFIGMLGGCITVLTSDFIRQLRGRYEST